MNITKDELSTAISQTGTEVRKFFFLREKICFDQLLLRIAFRHTVWISILLFFYYCSILLLFSHLEQLNSTRERLDQEDSSFRTLLDHINTTLSIKVPNTRTSNLLEMTTLKNRTPTSSLPKKSKKIENYPF